jgi:hypothetical protein
MVPNMEKMMSIFKEQNIFVIEDFSQCLNGKYQNKKVGTFGNVGIYSSSSIKTLDTYGGGLLICDSSELHKKYFFEAKDVATPPFHESTPENDYIFHSQTGGLSKVVFPDYEHAYKGLSSVANVQIFKDQLSAFKVFLLALGAFEAFEKALKQSLKSGEHTQDAEMIMELGKLFCTIVYGQLIAEQAVRMKLDERLTSLLFHQLIEDLNIHAIKIASLPVLGEGFGVVHKTLIKRMIETQKTKTTDIDAAIEMLIKGFAL